MAWPRSEGLTSRVIGPWRRAARTKNYFAPLLFQFLFDESLLHFSKLLSLVRMPHLLRPATASATGTTRQRPVAHRRRSPPTVQPRRGPAEARSGPSKRGSKEC